MKVGDLVFVRGKMTMHMKAEPNTCIDKVGVVVNMVTDPFDASVRIDVQGGPGFGRYMEHEVGLVENEEE